MMDRNHKLKALSGAAKRKKRRLEDEKIGKSNKRITSFVVINRGVHESISSTDTNSSSGN